MNDDDALQTACSAAQSYIVVYRELELGCLPLLQNSDKLSPIHYLGQHRHLDMTAFLVAIN